MNESGGRFGQCSSIQREFADIQEVHRSGDNKGAVFIAKYKADGQIYCLKERKSSELGMSAVR
jgi:hypothetical protein